MRQLFDELVANGEDAIDALIGRQEAVDLEFKVKENPSIGDASPGDRRRFGKALSAFSNSMGGLLVWGVVAKPNDGIDQASALQPIADIARFKSWAVGACSEVL